MVRRADRENDGHAALGAEVTLADPGIPDAVRRLAHDVNNKLQVILGNVDLMADQMAPDSPLAQDLQEIRRAARRARDLVRRELHPQTTEGAACHPAPVARDALDGVRIRLAPGSRVSPFLPPDLWRVAMDAADLSRVLDNALLNAVEAMPRGGDLRLEITNLRDADGVWVRVVVADTGHGIPAGELAHVFEPGYSTRRHGHASGLGLAIIRDLVERAGGSVELRSDPGGTTLELRLPAVP